MFRFGSPHLSEHLFAAAESDRGRVGRPLRSTALTQRADPAHDLITVKQVERGAAQVVILNRPLEVRSDDGRHGAELVHRILALKIHLSDGGASVGRLPGDDRLVAVS